MFTGVFEMQRKPVRILGFIFAAAMALCAHGQEHKPINVGTAHGLPFSDGILAGNTLYIAGQGGDDESGQLVPGGIVTETKVTLANVEKVLKAAGFGLKDVVSVTVYLADFKEFPTAEIRKPKEATRTQSVLQGYHRVLYGLANCGSRLRNTTREANPET